MDFERIFRAKGLIDGCTSVDQMAASLEQAAQWLRQAHAGGLTLDAAVEDDYALLVTSDPSLARRYGMHPSHSQPSDDSRTPHLTVVKGMPSSAPD